jgi:glycosyltransferase involved in cell wall biosynthesis
MLHIKQRIGVVIPAYNEEAAIGLVVSGLKRLREDDGLSLIDEIIVADNNSTDNTAKVATSAGATVVFEATPGYGHACMKAVSALNSPDIIVFVDGDNAFFPEQLQHLLQPFRENADLVIGSRTLGKASAGSLTLTQQWGNQLAVILIRYLWGQKYTDLGPFRAIRKECFDYLDMQELTYGWTVEMQIKALQAGYQVQEVPVNTRVRIGQSKVSGTIKGAIGAGVGILSTIAKLRWRQNSKVRQLEINKACD